MTQAARLSVRQLDHVHVFVSDRTRATRWYADVLDLKKTYDYTEHEDPDGPIVLCAADGVSHIARSTIAFRVEADDLITFAAHDGTRPLVDRGNSFSVYLCDPDGNPLELTTYETAEVRTLLAQRAAAMQS